LPKLRILQVSKQDQGGGANNVAWNLFRAYRDEGLLTWLAVDKKISDDRDVLVIPNEELLMNWTRLWRRTQTYFEALDGQMRSAWRFSRWARFIADPAKWIDEQRGIEDFGFPGTWGLLELANPRPDIVHCHNLHSQYFDLRALPWLSSRAPLFLTLHDAWMLSGHCAHSFNCERWQTGCGNCPDLNIYPAVKRDATDYNWRRKREIYSKSRLYVSTPSRWLMSKVEASILAPAIIEAKVIPYGIDLSVFRPARKDQARVLVDLPEDSKLILFAANGIRHNVFKDYQTMRKVIGIVAEHLQANNVLFVALGDDAPEERVGKARVRFVKYQKDPAVVARYYQAADVYLHAARVDTFPNTILESLACGTPVVATAVGGIPEQVKGLRIAGLEAYGWNSYGIKDATGMLSPEGDAEAMAASVERLLNDSPLRNRLSENASRDARSRFDLRRQVDDYLEWYGEILGKSAHEKAGDGRLMDAEVGIAS
jgi:glycosyltransferase involved in cell wall biosynthesis